MFTFALTQLIVFALLAVSAWGAGSIVARRLECESAVGLVSLRIVAGLATLGLVFMSLGLAGVLTVPAVWVVALVCLSAGAMRLSDLRGSEGEHRVVVITMACGAAPAFALALYPPIAFDETLYHLPTIERFAVTGSLPFVENLRFPVFPHLDEVLRVPLFLLGGDVATHLLSLLATIVTVGLLLAWFRERGEAPTGWLAAALFVSAPLVVQLATSGYVEALLTMFVAAAFYAFDRWWRTNASAWLLATGVFAGSAAAVKYPGLFWVGLLFLGVLLRRESRARHAIVFAVAALVALAPWYGRIVCFTGNPLFPFGVGVFGPSAWDLVPHAPRTMGDRLLALVRLPWDVLFARERTGMQPPFSPFLIALIPVVALRALRDPLVRVLMFIVAGYCAAWLVLPPDARYLEPALPLASAVGALAMRDVLGRISNYPVRACAIAAIITLLPGPLYALHRIVRYGTLPFDPSSRDAWLARQIPEYGAISFLNERAPRNSAVWLCEGEQLAYYFRGEMFGDYSGPARFALLTSAPDELELERRVAALGARYLLVMKRDCAVPAFEAGEPPTRFMKVYDDPLTTVYERIAR